MKPNENTTGSVMPARSWSPALWTRIARKMRKLTTIGPERYDDYGEVIRGTECETDVLDEAKLVGSRLKNGNHIVALDIDMPVCAVPSSTPGHYHLYIDHEISWKEYEALLDLLADIGVIEPGYAEVSKNRKETFLRTPWTVKPGVEPPEEN